jgi:membrane protein
MGVHSSAALHSLTVAAFNSMTALQRIAKNLWSAYQHFVADDGPRLAAAMAYYVALSFFPLLMILVAGLSAVMAGTPAGQDVQHRLLTVVQQQTSPVLREQIEAALATINRRALTGGPIGFLLLFVTAVAIFIQFESAFDRIWALPADPNRTWQTWLREMLLTRLKALAILIGVGLFFIVAIVASISWSAAQAALDIPRHDHPVVRWLLALPTNLGLHCLAFTIIYRFIPKPEVRWTYAFQGGVLAALLWEVGRQVLSIYLLRGTYLGAYGIIGSLIVIMLWAYYAMTVIFFGAEYVRVIGESPPLDE